MKIISVNIAKKKEITWKSKTWETGIFKKEVLYSIYLGKTDVKEDVVIDRKHHGGENMAVYAFAKEHYKYFEKLYPSVEFNNGIFGENLTVEGLYEKQIKIGDVFTVGKAIIQVSQPRLPCKTLSAVFNTNKIMKDFLNSSYSGIYFKVLKEGEVKKGDEFFLKEEAKNSLSVYDIYSLFTINKNNTALIGKAFNLKHLSERIKKDIIRKLNP
jgi:MOSC domain-containing protein YiiM